MVLAALQRLQPVVKSGLSSQRMIELRKVLVIQTYEKLGFWMPKDTTSSLPTLTPEDALHAKLIGLIGSDHFFDRLAVVLAEALPFKWLHLFQYFKDTAPIGLGNYPRNVAYKRGYENYLNFTYVINPSYRAFQLGTPSGVFLISDFIQDGYDDIIGSADCEIRIDESESIGYRTPGWPKNMTEFIVLVDDSKLVMNLGEKSPLPVEVLPMAVEFVSDRLHALGGRAVLRMGKSKDGPVVTDQGFWILDAHFDKISNPKKMSKQISTIPGVLDHGLFVDMATLVLVGSSDGSVRELKK